MNQMKRFGMIFRHTDPQRLKGLFSTSKLRLFQGLVNTTNRVYLNKVVARLHSFIAE